MSSVKVSADEKPEGKAKTGVAEVKNEAKGDGKAGKPVDLTGDEKAEAGAASEDKEEHIPVMDEPNLERSYSVVSRDTLATLHRYEMSFAELEEGVEVISQALRDGTVTCGVAKQRLADL